MSASRLPQILQKHRVQLEEVDWNPDSSVPRLAKLDAEVGSPELTPEMKSRVEFIRRMVAHGGPEVHEYDQLNQWLKELERDVHSGEKGAEYYRWLMSLFGEALSAKTMQGRSFTKPHGYHGDFEMIDLIYRQSTSEDPKLARWDTYFHAQAAPRAVRNRKDYFLDLLASSVSGRTEQLRVLNVASGPARDVKEWFDGNGTDSVRFDCVEMDSNAISYALNLCAPYTKSAFFYLANALRFNTPNRYDLVWSAGLFDYLNDRLFVKLLQRLLGFAKPGGEVVIGNFGTENPSRPYMELVGGWKLLHRSEEELRELALQAGADAADIRIGREPEGVNLFLHIAVPKDWSGVPMRNRRAMPDPVTVETDRLAGAAVTEDVESQRSKRLERGIQKGGSGALEKRIVNAILILTPFLGTLFSIYYFSTHKVQWFPLVQLVGWYFFTGMGIGIGFHRLFTHKSFKTHPALRFLFGFAGSLAFQGSVVRWIADHRRHHHFADRAPDTHTPHRYPKLHRIGSQIKNLWYAHVGWMFDDTTTDPAMYCADLLRDPVSVWLDRWYWGLTALSLLMPYGLGYLVGGPECAFQSLLLGGFVRTCLLHNVIWAVNSIGHTFGDRLSTQNDESRNNWILAIFTFGEGWHNNHHASPRCAYNNWRGYELDVNGEIINLMEKAHLIWDVNRTKRIAGVLDNGVKAPNQAKAH